MPKQKDPFDPTPRQSLLAVGKMLAEDDGASRDTDTLLADILDAFGGTRVFAQMLVVEFRAAKAGSMIRQKILEMIQRLVVVNTASEGGKVDPPSDMEDSELEAEAARLLAKGMAAHADP